MPIENCPCGGNPLDRFYSLFTCDHVCNKCSTYLNTCCNHDFNNIDETCDCECLNFYNINLQNVIQSKIKAFGYCEKFKALAIQYTNGDKKLYLNVEKDVYKGLDDLNKDLLSLYLEQNLSKEVNQCISIN